MEEEYRELVSSVRSAFDRRRTRDVAWRKAQLERLKMMYYENRDAIVEAVRRDLGKPAHEAMGSEVTSLVNDAIGCITEVEDWTRTRSARKSIPSLFDRVEIRPEPYGVVLVIGAWNYPMHVTMAPVAGAIAAGNCVVIKPSEIASNTAKLIEELVTKYLDNDCFKVVNGGVPETTALLKQRFDYIFYTGSTAVGKIISAAAAVHLTPCTLELGGKSPVYVADNCPNLKATAKRILWGKTMNSGQTCIAPDYVLCSKITQESLADEMKKVLREWYGEDARESKDLCRIVNKRHFQRVMGLLKTCNGTVVAGGEYDPSRNFISPTVLTDVDPEDDIMKEEIFGPLLPFVTVDSPEEAIDFINAREKPLVLYLFSEDAVVQDLFATHTSSGGFTVNDTLLHMGVESLPFGGVGASGMGSYHGEATFNTFSHFKSTLVRDLGWLGEKAFSVRYPPYKGEPEVKTEKSVLNNRRINQSLPTLSDFRGAIGFAAGIATAAVACSLL